MKCQYCGEPSTERFCCDWHRALCTAELYGCEARYGRDDRVIVCTKSMGMYNTLCAYCIHHLEKVVVHRCSGFFQKVEEV